jgi:hypothetical protein
MLTCDDGSNDGHASGACNVTDDLMQLHIHLSERFLHALNVNACTADQVILLANVASEHTDLVVWTKRGRKQSVAVELLEPLTVKHIAFTPGQRLDMMSVDEFDLEAAHLENLKQCNPVDAGRFHCHGLHPALLQPVC